MNSIYVHSSKRLSGTISDFEYRVEPPIDNITGVEFEDYIITNSIFTIDTSNNRLVVNQDAYASHTSQILDCYATPGYYTATDLATELKTILNAATGSAGTYNVLFDSTSQTFTFSCPTTSFHFDHNYTQMWSLIGFNTGADINSFSDAITSQNVVDLIRRKSVYVFIDGVKCFSQQGDGNSRQIGFKILLDKAFGEVCYPLHKPVKAHYNLTPFSLSSLRVSLRDENGAIIDPSEFQNLNWEFTIVLYNSQRE